MLKKFECPKDSFVLVLGDNEKKRKIFSDVISKRRSCPDEITIIFDSASYYSELGNGSYLMDNISEGSIMLDYISPIVNNSFWKRNVEEMADMIVSYGFNKRIKVRDANDAFWCDSATAASKDYWKNLLYLYRWLSEQYGIEKCFFGKVGIFSSAFRRIMAELANATFSTNVEKYDLPNYDPAAATQLSKSDSYNLLKDLLLFEAEAEGNDEFPFENTIRKKNLTSNQNFYTTIVHQMINSYQAIFATMNFAENNNREFLSFPNVQIESVNKPVFICSSGIKAVDEFTAIMLVISLRVIAEVKNKKICIIVPEIDKWGSIENKLEWLKSAGNLSFIYSYNSLLALGTQNKSEMETFNMLRSPSDYVIWGNSADETLTDVFTQDISSGQRRYELNEFENNCCALTNNINEITYMELPDIKPSKSPIARTRLILARDGEEISWFDQKSSFVPTVPRKKTRQR